jgi:hypothetical protein
MMSVAKRSRITAARAPSAIPAITPLLSAADPPPPATSGSEAEMFYNRDTICNL